jgi:hypothetical protein
VQRGRFWILLAGANSLGGGTGQQFSNLDRLSQRLDLCVRMVTLETRDLVFRRQRRDSSSYLSLSQLRWYCVLLDRSLLALKSLLAPGEEGGLRSS